MLPIVVGVCVCLCFCCALLCALSSFATILKRKRELVALLSLFYSCHVTVNVRGVGWSAVCDCGIS